MQQAKMAPSLSFSLFFFQAKPRMASLSSRFMAFSSQWNSAKPTMFFFLSFRFRPTGLSGWCHCFSLWLAKTGPGEAGTKPKTEHAMPFPFCKNFVLFLSYLSFLLYTHISYYYCMCIQLLFVCFELHTATEQNKIWNFFAFLLWFITKKFHSFLLFCFTCYNW